jgi:hypothetical protein
MAIDPESDFAAQESARILGLDESDQDPAYQALRQSHDPRTAAVLLRLLASEKPIHVGRAARVLARRKEVACLPQMKHIRSTLPPQWGLMDYRLWLDRAIDILSNFAGGASCRCNLYAQQQGFSNAFIPAREEEEGFISLEQIGQTENEVIEVRDYRCLICGRRWQVRCDPIGYHYPVYEWAEINDPPQAAGPDRLN